MEVEERLGVHMGGMDQRATSPEYQENKLVTAQNVLIDMFAGTIQEILEEKMDTHLSYYKNDVKNKRSTKCRNGKGSKGS